LQTTTLPGQVVAPPAQVSKPHEAALPQRRMQVAWFPPVPWQSARQVAVPLQVTSQFERFWQVMSLASSPPVTVTVQVARWPQLKVRSSMPVPEVVQVARVPQVMPQSAPPPVQR
jgi:hypothetical protein